MRRDSRNNTALACSMASPNLPMGKWFNLLLSFSGVLRKSIKSGVLSGPLTSRQRLRVSDRIAVKVRVVTSIELTGTES